MNGTSSDPTKVCQNVPTSTDVIKEIAEAIPVLESVKKSTFESLTANARTADVIRSCFMNPSEGRTERTSASVMGITFHIDEELPPGVVILKQSLRRKIILIDTETSNE